MHLRKTLAVGAAILAATVVGLTSTSTATATTPTGATPQYVSVAGASSPNGNVAFGGTFKGGTASFGGGTYGCVGGTVSGTVRRGAYTATPEMSFPTLNITCATPFGINAVINMNTGCAATLDFDAATNANNVHDGLVDVGTGAKFQRVPGKLTISPTCTARVSVLGNLCSAQVSGQADAYYDETVKTGNVQTLGLTGTGLSLSGGTGLCASILNGPFNLNNIEFNTSPILDFRLTP